jgi:hypothetical protein
MAATAFEPQQWPLKLLDLDSELSLAMTARWAEWSRTRALYTHMMVV